MTLKIANSQIEMIVFDFDGVMTDNRVITFSDGREAVICSRSDGYGIALLKKEGFKMLVVSSETNSVVSERCKKLGINCQQAVIDKGKFLEQEAFTKGFTLDNIIFVGNDLNDLPAMELVGFSVCVADSHPEILKTADLVLKSKGGDGAVREFADLILRN